MKTIYKQTVDYKQKFDWIIWCTHFLKNNQGQAPALKVACVFNIFRTQS